MRKCSYSNQIYSANYICKARKRSDNSLQMFELLRTAQRAMANELDLEHKSISFWLPFYYTRETEAFFACTAFVVHLVKRDDARTRVTFLLWSKSWKLQLLLLKVSLATCQDWRSSIRNISYYLKILGFRQWFNEIREKVDELLWSIEAMYRIKTCHDPTLLSSLSIVNSLGVY